MVQGVLDKLRNKKLFKKQSKHVNMYVKIYKQQLNEFSISDIFISIFIVKL